VADRRRLITDRVLKSLVPAAKGTRTEIGTVGYRASVRAFTLRFPTVASQPRVLHNLRRIVARQQWAASRLTMALETGAFRRVASGLKPAISRVARRRN